jgi:nitrate ABC transporter ATP-binding subunit
MTEKIRVSGLDMRFESERLERTVTALEGIDLCVAAGEFICLLGPSGCGKTTLLNLIAGFLQPTQGTIIANGSAVTGPGPERGVVFQEYGLYPWFTVSQNIAFGPRMRGASRAEQEEIVRHYVSLVHLGGFEQHYPGELSGGMKQRVSIARALANRPDILLMDEPFGALDAMTRETMQEELLRIWDAEKRTCVFVTHSINEAIYLADRIVILSARPGRIKDVVRIDLPRLRERASSEFFELYRNVDLILREELARLRAGPDVVEDAGAG